MKLHLGCGRTRREGWTNVDRTEVQGVTDLVVDLDGSKLGCVLPENSVTESLGVHFLEHLRYPLDFMGALWRVTEPGGLAVFEVPYGSSDDAWEDPTHVRPYFMNSWAYFGQPSYWRADYGYRGDWAVADVVLGVDGQRWADVPLGDITDVIKSQRNVVKVMRAELHAVKPARDPMVDSEPTPVRVALI